MTDRALFSNCGFEIFDNKIWFVPFFLNMLCGYSIDDNKIVFAMTLSDVNVDVGLSYNTIEIDGKLLSIPARGNDIYILDKNSRLNRYSVEDLSTKEKYSESCKLNSSIIVFPIEALDILIINGDEIKKVGWNKGAVLSCIVRNSKVYFTNGTNNIYTITESGGISCIKITDLDNICNIQFWNNYTVAVSSDGGVYLIDLNKGKCERQILRAKKDDYFTSTILFNDKLFLFPNKDYTTIWIYDLLSDSVSYLSVEEDENINEKWIYNSFGEPKVHDSKIFVMSPKHNALLIIDNDTIYKKTIMLEAPYEEKVKLMKYRLNNKSFMIEDDIATLDVYLNALTEGKFDI